VNGEEQSQQRKHDAGHVENRFAVSQREWRSGAQVLAFVGL
jgi:hypothetical protein